MRCLQPRLCRGEQGAGLGGSGLGLKALRLQPQPALVVDARLLERLASLRYARGTVVVGEATKKVALGYPVTSLDGPLDHPAGKL